PAAATPPATQRSATPAPAKPSDNPKPAASTARRAFFAPAQSSLPTGDPSLAELQITPQQLGLSVKKAHSRRERRKRRRAVQPR
ncbi:MAG TPA: hypothetical protein VKH44_06480, partial [Pirellulaceae bacterium]|nr:hypothetical protein [Pirellulaceae bacterium]